jgi:hypothetical protein
MSKIIWPQNPKDGEKFTFVCPISGATFRRYVFFMGTWQFLKNE